MITLTAVRPPARFGAIKVYGNYVKFFREKNLLDSGWINGGFFVVEPKFLSFIKNDQTIFEKKPLLNLVSKKQLYSYFHKSFWQCMDSVRDKKILESYCKKKINPPWLKNEK